MGYDLSATFGYGVKIQEFEQDSILSTEERDLVEDLYGNSCFHITYAGTDQCNTVYLIHKDSILGADWLGNSFKSEDLIDLVHKELVFGSELQMELLKNDIVISGEHFQWYMMPLWF